MSSIHEPLLAIVKERRSSYTKSVRLLFLSFATLVAFQFLVFDPFVDAQTRLIEVETEQTAYAAVAKNIGSRQAAYSKLGEDLKKEIDTRLTEMMKGIASDLKLVTDEVINYLEGDLDPFEGDVSEPEELSLRDIQAMQMQSVAQMDIPAMPRPTLMELDSGTVAALRATQSWSEIREILQPEIQSAVIEVRFSEYNKQVQSFVDRSLQGGEKARAWKPKDLEGLPEELKKLWSRVDTATEQAIENLKSLAISQPENKTWWWTTGGKDGVAGLELERSEEVLDDLLETAGYDAVLSSLSLQIEVLAEVEKKVALRQEEVEVAFSAFKDTIAQLLGPLDWLPLNMNDFVFLMPLLVACSLGGGVAWVLRKRMAYIGILDTASVKSTEVDELRFTLDLDSSRSRLRGLLLISLVVGLAWVVYLNVQLLAFVALLEEQKNVLLAGSISYSSFLNWGVSLVVLVGGSAISFQSLRDSGVGEA